jgi:hypothetical protein
MARLPSALAAALLAEALLWQSAARADEDSYQSQYEPPPAERRSDFLLGVQSGFVLGGASGYPNEAEKLGRREYRGASGLAFGSQFQVWLGGALRDWFSFGFGLGLLRAGRAERDVTQFAFIVRLESYPLFSLGGPFRDLGLVLDAGAGGAALEDAGATIADGGAISHLGAGVVYEWLRLGPLTVSPVLAYTHAFSPSFTSNFASLGARVVFYGGP